jgi:prepilin-type processing-associated H-X9-DG protein
MMQAPHPRSQVVLLAVIIAVALAVLIPYLVHSREASRLTQCQGNLREIGRSFEQFADADPRGRYCSGAYDWRRDGCPDQVGWVADLVNNGYCRPIDLICPSNPLQCSEGLAELYDKDYQQSEKVLPDPDLARAGICGAGPDVWGTPGTPQRADAIHRYMLDKGYASNYTASWYFIRTAFTTEAEVVEENGHEKAIIVHAMPLDRSLNWKSRKNTRGPLWRRRLQYSKVPSGMVPLLGDGGTFGAERIQMPTDLAYKGARLVSKGQALVTSYNPGPATYDGLDIVPLPAGTVVCIGEDRPCPTCPEPDCTVMVLSGQCIDERDGLAYGSAGLQDTRGWACLHAGSCNLLMADGSVQVLTDANGDGLLNPGFPVAPHSRRTGSNNKAAPQPELGYQDAVEDLPRQRVFSGLSINNNEVYHNPINFVPK